MEKEKIMTREEIMQKYPDSIKKFIEIKKEHPEYKFECNSDIYLGIYNDGCEIFGLKLPNLDTALEVLDIVELTIRNII